MRWLPWLRGPWLPWMRGSWLPWLQGPCLPWLRGPCLRSWLRGRLRGWQLLRIVGILPRLLSTHERLRLTQPAHHAPLYSGKLSCFFAGISTFLSLSIASARAMRFRVECGMMTSSM